MKDLILHPPDIVATPQHVAGSAAAVALSTLCPLRAAVCGMRSVTTTGGGSAGTEVRTWRDPSLLPPPTPFKFSFSFIVLYDKK